MQLQINADETDCRAGAFAGEAELKSDARRDNGLIYAVGSPQRISVLNPRNTWKLGESILSIRPIRPQDEALWLGLMTEMSWVTRYRRGARRVENLKPEDVRRAVSPDPVNEIALVAVATQGGEEKKMAGVARATQASPGTWTFALVVLDAWQRRGVGRRLMIALMQALHERRGKTIEGDVLASNRNMLDFVARLGFEIRPHPEDSLVKRVTRRLRQRDPRS